MTATSRGRVAIAALIAVLAFGGAFAVRKATAGSSHSASLPVPLVLPASTVRASGVALPAAAALPALRHPPRPAAPAPSTPAPSPTPAPATPAPSAPSAPAAPPSGGGGGGGGPVVVG